METREFSICGNVVDVLLRKVDKAEVFIKNGRIERIIKMDAVPDVFILPGIVDAHVHIESSMLIPQEFASLAVRHGTVATVSDPHEIANVCGIEGVNFMIDDANKVPFKFYFGAPSCVPATSFETSGFEIQSNQIKELLARDEIKYLSEMMNFPGVLFNDSEVHRKIEFAKLVNKPVDGHAPSLSGDNLSVYANVGITTDHESTTIDEAIEKIKLGIKLQIREGSAAKNFDALASVIDLYPNDVMLCTDDCHPDDLLEKHILDLIKRGVKKGINLYNLLRAATYNPINHYNLEVGMLQVNDSADFIIVNNLTDFHVLDTYIGGQNVYSDGKSLIKVAPSVPINNFVRTKILINDIRINNTNKNIKVILANDGDLYTGSIETKPYLDGDLIVSDIANDILKIVVVNRYNNEKPVVGFIKNIGLTQGAIAQSVAHDSHNIIAVGVKDEEITLAINTIIENKGGISAINSNENHFLALPVAGLMSNESGEVVANMYAEISKKPKDWGSKLNNPFMTLSFMALLVIPELKIGDKGLFDGQKFNLTSLFVD